MKRFLLHVPLVAALCFLGGCDSPPPEAAADADAARQDAMVPREPTGEAGEAGEAGDGQSLLTIMQRLAADMAGMQHALWLEDFDQVESHAAAIAEHPPMTPEEVSRIRQELGDEMAAFEAADEEVHEASVRMYEAALSGDIAATLDALSEVQRGCVACHERFRERLRTTP